MANHFISIYKPSNVRGFHHTMRMLEPLVFKKLSMITTDSETGLKFVFSYEKTPNYEIAEACRASATIPMVLKPVRVGNREREMQLIDG